MSAQVWPYADNDDPEGMPLEERLAALRAEKSRRQSIAILKRKQERQTMGQLLNPLYHRWVLVPAPESAVCGVYQFAVVS